MILSSYPSLMKKTRRTTSIPRLIFPSLSTIWLCVRTPELRNSISLRVIERRLIRIIKDMERHLFENNQNEDSKT